MFDDPFKNWTGSTIGTIRADIKEIESRLDAIEKRHADEDEGLRASAGIKTVGAPPVLPCPFCGSEARLIKYEQDSSWNMVQCVDCQAEGTLSKIESQAIAAWNRAKR